MSEYYFDADADGLTDDVAYDSNADGVYDTVGYDTNDDGALDLAGIDTDVDGFTDTYALDTDGSGTADLVWTDHDGDGDAETAVADVDGNGSADYRYTETNPGVGVWEPIGFEQDVAASPGGDSIDFARNIVDRGIGRADGPFEVHASTPDAYDSGIDESGSNGAGNLPDGTTDSSQGAY